MQINKRGFTFVELIVVIALMGVILTISILSISSIQIAVKEKQNENLINRIKVAAQKYVSDNGIKRVYVDTLIKQGLLEADDIDESTGTSDIKNPVNGESYKCYYYDFSDENNPQFVASAVCDVDIEKDTTLTIKYCRNSAATCGSLSTVPSDWVNYTNMVLGAVSNDTSIVNLNDPSVEFAWISPLAPDTYDTNKYHQIEVPANGYINDVYELRVTKGDKVYSGNVRIKIDNKKPIINDFVVSNANSWQREKTISAKLIDNESGLKRYKITKYASSSSGTWTNISGNLKNVSKTITENAKFYLHVEDNVGNITSQEITVHKIDRIAPSCTNSGDNYDWTTRNVRIYWGCDDTIGAPADQISGCKTGYTGGSQLYSSSAFTKTISSYTIMDNAGNSRTCPSRNAGIYIDKEDPWTVLTKLYESDYYYWTGGYAYTIITWLVNGYDNHSGVTHVCIVTGSPASASDCVWQSGNSMTKTYTIYGYTWFQSYAKDAVGNIAWDGSAGDVCDLGTYSYSYCSDSGYEVHQRYNECIADYEYKTTSTKCYQDYISCSDWSDCQNGMQYKSCQRYYGGVLQTVEKAKSQTCEDIDQIYGERYRNCDLYYITTCTSTTCNYTSINGTSRSGTVNRMELSYAEGPNCTPPAPPTPPPAPEPSQPSKSICDYTSQELFGNYKNHLAGNSGAAVSANRSWGNWCHSAGTVCYDDIGYERYCVTDKCGSYLGWTARQIKKTAGCDFAAYWCQC